MDIDIQVDVDAFESDVDEFIHRDWADGIVEGLNRWAAITRARIRAAMTLAFDRPNPFTLQGANFLPATNDGDRDPAVLITLMSLQAKYLELEVFGGARVAGDYATTRQGVLVPGRDAPKDEFGNLPRNFVANALSRRGVGWIRVNNGQDLALVEEIPGQKTRYLALIVPEIDYKPRFDFYGLVEDSAARDLGDFVAGGLSRSLAEAV